MMHVLLFSLLSLFFHSSYAGFSQEAAILRQQNFVPIEQLYKGSMIIGYDEINNKIVEGIVDCCITHKTSLACRVICDCDSSISFTASPNQLVMSNNEWCPIKNLKQGDRLWCYQNAYVVVQEIQIIMQETELVEISVVPAHTFFVTSARILVHNHPAIIVTTAPLVASIIPASVKAIGVLGVVGTALYSLFAKNARSSINRNSINNSSNYSTPSLPPEDPEDEKSFYEKIKNRADRIARTKRFGKLYRDPETKLWWSKDNAHHGGSRYKVFKEGNRGFEWKFDGDAMGKVIENKHKGPIGRFIPYTEVIFLK